MGPAARHWAEQLHGWAVPDHVLAVAPASPWGFLPGMFDVDDAEPADTPARRLALAALGSGASVLDVGCGGGRAALALVPPATTVVGVDERPEAAASFLQAAGARGVAAGAVVGAWPAAAAEVAPADVVVCHHVLYNAADLVPFLQALGARARRRVVCEVGAVHPLTYLAPLWRRFWGLERPAGPSAADAVAVLRELGIDPVVEVAAGVPGHWRSPEQQVLLARKRLCLGPERDAEIAAAIAELPPAPDEVWALAWSGLA